MYRFGDNHWGRLREGHADEGGPKRPSLLVILLRLFVPLVAAAMICFLPEYPGLTPEARKTLFGLLLTVGWWSVGAMPDIAVGLLAIAWNVLVFDRFSELRQSLSFDDSKRTIEFMTSLGAPVVWLLLAGLVFSIAFQRTQMMVISVGWVTEKVGERPWWLLAGCMTLSYLFSFTYSGMAVATAMLGLLLPIVNALAGGDQLRRGLLLGCIWAMALGEAATIFGSPVNAIVGGQVDIFSHQTFVLWMYGALVPSLILLVALWCYLIARYPAWVERVDFQRMLRLPEIEQGWLPTIQRNVVLIVVFCTLSLWVTEPLHKIPSIVIGLLPIAVLIVSGVIGVSEIRSLRWDTLILVAAGLSLGFAAEESGLVNWFGEAIGQRRSGAFSTAIGYGYFACLLSTVVPRLAVATLLAPFAAVIFPSNPLVAPMMLSFGIATSVLLPYSTPQNLTVFNLQEANWKDFIQGGIVLGVVAPLVVWVWTTSIVIPKQLLAQ